MSEVQSKPSGISGPKLDRAKTLRFDPIKSRFEPLKMRNGKSLPFSFCTLTTDLDQYKQMVSSFVQKGFTPEVAEFLLIDNSHSNTGDGYGGHNLLMNYCDGSYLIFCHQDVLAIDSRFALEAALAELDLLDDYWAVAGNAGYGSMAEPARRISDKYGDDQFFGSLPHRVNSLDENFFVLDASKRISFSAGLSGFHCYATDLVINADFCGYRTYVIDFHLRHLGDGSKGDSFETCRRALQDKITAFCTPRLIKTPSTKLSFGPANKFARWVTTKFDSTR